jgi:hypothetical protein
VADRVNIQPFLPSAPTEYKQSHQSEVQRALDTLFGMLQNPGLLRGTNLTLTNLKDSDAGLETNALFKIGSVVHIAPYVPSKLAYVAVTGAYTVLADDELIKCTAGPYTVALPTAVGIEGKVYTIKNSGTGNITVDANGTETIDGSLTQVLTQYDALKIASDGANWIII